LSKKPGIVIRFREDDETHLSLAFGEHDLRLFEEIEKIIKEEYDLSFEMETIRPGRINARLSFPPDNPDLREEIRNTIYKIVKAYI